MMVLMALLVFALAISCHCFVLPSKGVRLASLQHAASRLHAHKATNEDAFGMPAALKAIADALNEVKDDKMRYKQILFLAEQARPMDAAHKTSANTVPGCLSVVFVHATMDADRLVHYQGDSDSQLTKGLVTLLVNGLSGSSAQVIQQVQPEFIKYAGAAKSLTPGRNNGFLNMLKLMKEKAQQLEEQLVGVSSGQSSCCKPKPAPSAGPIAQAMREKLSLLQPVELVVEDQSHLHVGHSGAAGGKGETHFAVKVVADCFGDLSLKQRHQMIHTLLMVELQTHVHALSIVAKAPGEK